MDPIGILNTHEKEITMTVMEFGPDDGIYYEYNPPRSGTGCTFVCFNALTGETGMWETSIAPQLRENGHGTLLFNFRGQAKSPFSAGTRLDMQRIVADARQLIETLKPPRSVFVGLSIGGLFAARVWLAGVDAVGMVLINTLRQNGPRLEWINAAIARCAEVGGMDLMRDLFFPLLFNEDWLSANRANHLQSGPYDPIDRGSGHHALLTYSCEADWDLPYEDLTLPALVITGLQDHIFYEEFHVDKLLSRMPRATRMDFPDSGHMIPVERPQPLADALLAFAENL
jgi:3-oxoadipate enol-lactonase